MEILGSEGNTACQLILAGDPEFTSAGARQVEFIGRTDNPDMTLAEDEFVCELGDDDNAGIDDAGVDETATDDGVLLLPPPPPHDSKNMKLEITNNFFTLFFTAITSRSNTN